MSAPANDNRAAYRTSFTGENEWYTPGRHIELAREVLGQIDVGLRKRRSRQPRTTRLRQAASTKTGTARCG